MIFDAIRKHTKIVIFIVVIAFGVGGAFMGLGGLFFGGTPQFQRGDGQVRAVATVDGADLYYQDLYTILYNYQQQYPQQIRGMDLLSFKYRILDTMIEDKIVSQEAEMRNISVTISEEEIEEELDMLISFYADSREEFELILQNSNYSIDQLREEIRQELTREGISQVLWEEVVEDVTITEENISAKVEEVRARHILIGEGEDGALLAANIRERLLDGEDFAELAREYSTCPSGSDGGDLGFFKRGSMVAPFEEVAFSLPIGEISEVVETEFGHHIIRVDERKDETSLEEEEREELLQELTQNKQEEIYQEWLASRKMVTEIVINDPSIRGYKHQVEDNLEEAIQDYQTALEHDPDNAYLYGHLGKLYIELGEKQKAIEAYKEAVELAPYDMQLLFALGNLYKDEGDKEEALLVYDEIKEWAGNDLMLHHQLMNVYKELGEEERFLAQEEKVEEIRERQMAEYQRQLEEMERANEESLPLQEEVLEDTLLEEEDLEDTLQLQEEDLEDTIQLQEEDLEEDD